MRASPYRIIAITAVVLCWQALAQKNMREPDFVINPNRSYLYIQFDHFGPGSPRSEGERLNRVWLRLVNNCRISISVTANGFEEGHKPVDEIAIQDRVVHDSRFEIIEATSDMATDALPQKLGTESPPPQYSFDVGSPVYISPGKSILFSFPTNQFRADWHIEIPYEFVLPKGKGPRPNDIGGYTVMKLFYGLYSLPKDIQRKVEEENAAN